MMSFSMLVDLTMSLLEENKHLKADKEALIAGQETLQKYLAIIETNGISVEKYKDSINCLEKACDELKEVLKKKDAELKAVRHYFNESVKDLKKAHVEIERLKGNLNIELEGFASEYDRKIKAEAINELAKRFENELTEKVEEFYFEEEHENFMSVNKVLAFLDNLAKEMTEPSLLDKKFGGDTE